MKLFRTVAAGVIALTLTMGAATVGVTAQTTGDATICVAPRTGEGQGSINVTIANAEFDPVTYDATDEQVTSKDVVVTVTDTRGVVGSWSVTVSGSDFDTFPDSTIPFDSEALSLTKSSLPTTEIGGFETWAGSMPTTDDSDDSPITIITATNVGTSPSTGYVFTSADSQLTVPEGTLVGNYKSTLTVTLTSMTDNSDACVSEGGDEVEGRVADVRNA